MGRDTDKRLDSVAEARGIRCSPQFSNRYAPPAVCAGTKTGRFYFGTNDE
ncbi:hypothetical protein ABIE78_001678 [Sinorhizobium fredii]